MVKGELAVGFISHSSAVFTCGRCGVHAHLPTSFPVLQLRIANTRTIKGFRTFLSLAIVRGCSDGNGNGARQCCGSSLCFDSTTKNCNFCSAVACWRETSATSTAMPAKCLQEVRDWASKWMRSWHHYLSLNSTEVGQNSAFSRNFSTVIYFSTRLVASVFSCFWNTLQLCILSYKRHGSYGLKWFRDNIPSDKDLQKTDTSDMLIMQWNPY